jgi:CheY-like chemotaxis protein
VADSGIGMSEAELPRLFHIFTQTDESTTRKFGGTGLGLTISQKLTRLLGGDIGVKSAPGVGSTFSFWINIGPCSGVDMISDLAEASLDALPEPANSQDIMIRGRILLAEDGVDNQRLISTHLRMAGAEVVIADNGQAALETALSQPFSLILMDMQMPEMDGYTAVAELRRRGFTVPIIALTAYAMAEDRAKCLNCGCSAYLSKPIEKEIFLRTISQYLGNEIPPAAKVTEAPAAAAPLDPSGPIGSTLLDHPGMKPIIIEFVQGLSDEVVKMQNMLGKKDLQSLKRVVHQLRGSGGGYGFDAISTAAAAAEESIKAAHNLDVIDREIKSLIGIIRRVEGFEDQKADGKKVVL